MPKQPFISIPLDIPDVRVLQTDLTQADELMLTVERTLESTTCRRCGRTITDQHGEDRPRLLRHLPILGRPVYLRIRPKRFRCPYCDDHPTTTQERAWYDPNALHTKAYERHLIVQLVNSTLTDVVAKEDVRVLQELSWLTRALFRIRKTEMSSPRFLAISTMSCFSPMALWCAKTRPKNVCFPRQILKSRCQLRCAAGHPRSLDRHHDRLVGA